MPFSIAVIFTIFATHMLWQGWRILSKVKKPSAKEVFFFFRLFVGKFALMLLALSYWSSSYCASATRLDAWLLPVLVYLTFLEVGFMRGLIVGEQALRASPRFYPALALQILVSLIIPTILLVISFKVVALGQCA